MNEHFDIATEFLDSIVPCSIELFLGLQPEMAELDDDEENDDEDDEDDDDDEDDKKKSVFYLKLYIIRKERSLVVAKVIRMKIKRLKNQNANNNDLCVNIY